MVCVQVCVISVYTLICLDKIMDLTNYGKFNNRVVVKMVLAARDSWDVDSEP